MRLIPILAVLLMCATGAPAQELVSVTWPTQLGPRPIALPDPAADFLPALRAGLIMLPESQVVKLALSRPDVLNLEEKTTLELQRLAAERYQMIAADSLFSKAESQLPYGYLPMKPVMGQALVYLPAKAGASTPVILFLHGDGGSFLYYQHLLAQVFPDHIIICPAYSAFPGAIPAGYLTECLAAVAKRTGYPLAKPELMGLSAGGFAACKIYTESPGAFTRVMVIAAYPIQGMDKLFGPGMTASFIIGGEEPSAVSGYFQKLMGNLRAQGTAVQSHVVPGADHFFLLTHREETVHELMQWELSPRPAAPAK